MCVRARPAARSRHLLRVVGWEEVGAILAQDACFGNVLPLLYVFELFVLVTCFVFVTFRLESFAAWSQLQVHGG